MSIHPPRYLYHTGIQWISDYQDIYGYWHKGESWRNAYWSGAPIAEVWLPHTMRERIVEAVNNTPVGISDLPVFLQYRSLNPKR